MVGTTSEAYVVDSVYGLLVGNAAQILVTYLKYTPGYTAERLSKGQNLKRRSKNRNKYRCCHPSHEEHHCWSTPKAVLAYCVNDEACQLANKGRV